MNAVVLLSGGLDSQVLLASLRHKYDCVYCLGFDYGQKHKKELRHAIKIAEFYDSFFDEIKLPKLKGSSLTGSGDIPKGLHFEDPRQSSTVVPNRNAVMLSFAAAYGFAVQANVVLYAPHSGDSAIYPDCRPEFVESISKTSQLGCGVSVMAPFLTMSKRDIVQLGRVLKVPMEMSWSCYEGSKHPCGQCGACVERTEAMK